jgi:beta-mannosidase
VELSGTWRAHLADEGLRRGFHEPGFDDLAWDLAEVPGHWATASGLGTAADAVLYRRAFTSPRPRAGRRAWLQFDGIFSQGDVWLDGAYVGDTEGYFVPHGFEVTDALRRRDDHILAVEVACGAGAAPGTSRVLTGAFQTGDHLPASWNPGGIWRPVHVRETGPVAIRRGRVLCREATEERATLAIRLVVDSDGARAARFNARVLGVEHDHDAPLAAGENRVEWTVTVPRPPRWWPHALGSQPLHDVRVEVRLDGDVVSDGRTWRTGLRSIEMRNWVCRVNGERIFLKGINASPLRPDLAAAKPSELRAALRTVRDAGLDLVRLHTHISRPDLYTAADELGLLIWQDFPLHGRYARSVRPRAVQQAREAIDLLGHHPSIAIWCGHDEPYAIEGARRRRPILPGVFPQQVPTWNRTVLDRSVKRVFEKHDGTRPVVAHSGVLPHLPQLDGTDAHLWFGWYGGQPEDLAAFAATLPRHVRFVSAFGAQAAPDGDDLGGAEGWPDPDWERLAADHGLDAEVMLRVVPPGAYRTHADWVAATQAHQARVVKHAIETLRRLKYRPTGGFAAYRLHDPTPQIGFGLLDATGRPKQAWHALVEACRPVIVVADPLPDPLEPGRRLALDVHVVSDERTGRNGLVEACLRAPAGARTWRWEGELAADSCTRVGRIEWTVPASEGDVTLELRLTTGSDVVTNRYRSRIG